MTDPLANNHRYAPRHIRERLELSERYAAAWVLVGNPAAKAICESLGDLRLLLDAEES